MIDNFMERFCALTQNEKMSFGENQKHLSGICRGFFLIEFQKGWFMQREEKSCQSVVLVYDMSILNQQEKEALLFSMNLQVFLKQVCRFLYTRKQRKLLLNLCVLLFSKTRIFDVVYLEGDLAAY